MRLFVRPVVVVLGAPHGLQHDGLVRGRQVLSEAPSALRGGIDGFESRTPPMLEGGGYLKLALFAFFVKVLDI